MNSYQSNPRSLTFTPANISLTGFASAVTGTSWPLTATGSGDNLAHKVTIQNNSANTKAAINIVILGLDENGASQTETLAGPAGSATVTSTKFYSSLTSVTPASTWGADTANIGWAGSFASVWLNVNFFAEDILTLVADVTGTMNFTLNQTFDQYSPPVNATARWFAIASSQTADGAWQTTGGASGVQFIANSYSNGATLVLNANPTFVANASQAAGGAPSNVNLAQVGGAAISEGQKTMAASLPVVIASDQSAITSIGLAYSAPTTITRPANQTPYSANDVVGGAITFANMGSSAGRIMLTSSQLELDIAAIPTGMSSFFLALYNVTPPSAIADNSPWDLPSGDRASFLGIVQLGSPVDLGSTFYIEQNIINKQIKLAGTSLFGYLVTVGGYTPAANSEVYVATIHSVGLGA